MLESLGPIEYEEPKIPEGVDHMALTGRIRIIQMNTFTGEEKLMGDFAPNSKEVNEVMENHDRSIGENTYRAYDDSGACISDLRTKGWH